MKSIKHIYSSYFIAFILATMVLTTVGIKVFVSQLLLENESAILSIIVVAQLSLMLAIICFCYFTFRRLSQRLIILREHIDQLSKGNADLTTRVEIKSNDEIGEIGHSVNNFIDYLHTLMQSVNNSSVKISDSLMQVEDQTQLTRCIILGHVKETEQAVTAMEEMSTTANIVATNAAEAATSTQQIHDSVSQSKSTVVRASGNVQTLLDDVEDTVVNIESMAQNTQQISAVLTVIGEIAEQTNLLALNAAIEAARAGEQGRGFAVVADEVRNLASRTDQSTNEIQTMIDNLQNEASSAVAAMLKSRELTTQGTMATTDTSTALVSIGERICHISDMNTQVATATEEQSTVVNEINQNIVEINDITQCTADTAEGLAKSSHELRDLSVRLGDMVGVFKL